MSNKDSKEKDWIKERLFQEKNKDHNTKLWGNIFLTIVVMAFFVGVGVGGAYYSVQMNKEVQRALDLIAVEKQIDFNELTPEMQEIFQQYNVNKSRNHTGRFINKLESCGSEGCVELG